MKLRLGLCVLILWAAWTVQADEPKPQVVRLEPGPNAQKEVQRALIRAKPGMVIELGAGTFEFHASLSLTVPRVTLRGQGMGKTVLCFAKQDQGKEGMLVTADGFTAEDFTLADAKGDGLKINGVKGVTLRRVEATWRDGPKETNGAYGLYPVQCERVLIEDCQASHASDAGIYVGQSKQIVIRRCKATRNVAGIEVENSFDADVYENQATDNTGGILVFDLPDLPLKNGGRVRVFNNVVSANNHVNFAPKGNIVATVPPGTGIMVLATDQVEIFGNKISDNKTCNLAIVSYLITQRPIQDRKYDPFPEGIYVHDNEFKNGGFEPSGEMGMLLGTILGKPIPDILYDGCVDKRKMVNGKLPEKFGLKLANNGSATFANLGYDGSPILQFVLRRPQVDRAVDNYEGSLPPLKPVMLGSN